MSSNFKSRFMNRMEHITKSGQTSSQMKSSAPSTAVPSVVGRSASGRPSIHESTEFSQQIPNSDYISNAGSVTQDTLSHSTRSNVSNHIAANFFPVPVPSSVPELSHKPTAQQFQNYLNEFSPIQNAQRMSNPQHFNYNQSSNMNTNSMTNNMVNQITSSSYPEFSFKENYGINNNQQSHHSRNVQYQPVAVTTNYNVNNVINADFTAHSIPYDPHHVHMQNMQNIHSAHDTQSEDFGRKQRNERMRRAQTMRQRASTNSARPSAHDRNNRRIPKKPPLRRPVSLEFSRKPRKIKYKPYTLSDLSAINGPVSSGTGTLGPDLEDERVRSKNENLQKIQKYAELVNMKNKQHRPKPKVQSSNNKSKSQIAKEYARNVNRANKKKMRYKSLSEGQDQGSSTTSGYRTSPQFKRSGNAAVSQSHSYHHHSPPRGVKKASGGREQTEKLQELQQLHMRNRAIAQHILNDTFG